MQPCVEIDDGHYLRDNNAPLRSGGTAGVQEPGRTQPSLFLPEARPERSEQRAGANDRLTFLGRHFVMATLPHRDPGSVTWRRTNGRLSLGIQAGFDPVTNQSYGLPFGSIPRLLLLWVTTEAKRTNSPRLELGRSLAEFMRSIGMAEGTGGGKRGGAKLLHNQAQRLFQARISFVETGRAQYANMQVASHGSYWWRAASPGQSELWETWVQLDQSFFECITSSAVPLEADAIAALKASPLALDLYAWLAYEAYRAYQTGRARTVAWSVLANQFGSAYGTSKDFSRFAKVQMERVLEVMPSVRVSSGNGKLTILSSSRPPVVPRE